MIIINYRKIFLNILVIMLIFILFPNKVNANTINKISMDIYIDNSGNAAVTEVWDTNLNKGTEGYKEFSNLNNSYISNFSVIDKDGVQYGNIIPWNSYASFSEKKYKSGISTSNGKTELCWGISSYGDNQYTLKYTINNFVTQYEDVQGIYFNLLNLNQKTTEVVDIKIRANTKFSLDNSKIWGFGYDGQIIFENGNIVLKTNKGLSKNDYMVALVRFEHNLFNTSSKVEKSFDEIYDEAVKDSDYNKNRTLYMILDLLKVVFLDNDGLLIMIGIPLGLMILSKLMSIFEKNKFKSGPIKYVNYSTEPIIRDNYEKKEEVEISISNKILPNEKEINYFREIPCNKDIKQVYWICYQYKIVPITELKKGVIGAILLKWVKDNKIIVNKLDNKLFNFKDNNYAIDLNNVSVFDSSIENDLFQILKQASNENNILEAKEFEKWCENNYLKLNEWFDSLLSLGQIELTNIGLITEEMKTVKGMYNGVKKVAVSEVTEKVKEEAIKLIGLKKYLLDFSLISEKEYLTVHLWEEYLIFANMLGIADKVEEQFSKLYPNLKSESVLNTEFTTLAIRNIVEIGYKKYEKIEEEKNKPQKRERYSGSDRSSGSGGSSSSSGGSSSGGSSGGGFR